MAFWNSFAQGFLQLHKALRRCLHAQPFEGWFPTLVDDQFTIPWSGPIDLRCNLGEPRPEVFDESLGSHGQVETLAILRHEWCALLPGEKLATIIGKLFGARHIEIACL